MDNAPKIEMKPIKEEPKIEVKPEVCQQCGGNTRMLDSNDPFVEFWECTVCGINAWNLPLTYRGGTPASFEFAGIRY